MGAFGKKKTSPEESDEVGWRRDVGRSVQTAIFARLDSPAAVRSARALAV